ncbi:STY4526/YPO1902 family pathogenicity island replication protein [Cardiobacterium hominis]|mgnify:FL=1|jgi:hypothetical protein|uniref:STY4526/YPO1902 family pathogenicity island replication protein n=1 Tax=Cardiobacterium hominis TaxID=2718 RepID=UPI000F187266|nr:STY4526/YPO1902 family pathogenicity island replication protein [Cardiobacterium hominis]RKW13979.1 MAG: DUF2857 family protein [Cardiobacterium sp.]
MNSNDREALARISANLLIELLSAARQHKGLYLQLGISQETFADLSRLNIAELCQIADGGFVSININERMLNLRVQNALHSRDREELINDALRFGASRPIMYQYLKMSHAEFQTRRMQLGLREIRKRPQQLSSADYGRLSDLHGEYVKHHGAPTGGPDHLRCLVWLAEKSSNDLNRIYEYYYKDNIDLFRSSMNRTGGTG